MHKKWKPLLSLINRSLKFWFLNLPVQELTIIKNSNRPDATSACNQDSDSSAEWQDAVPVTDV